MKRPDARQEEFDETEVLKAAVQSRNVSAVKMVLDEKWVSDRRAINAAYRGAAYHGRAPMVDVLLSRGADINCRSHYDGNQTALMHAVYDGRVEMVRHLLSRGAESSVKRDDGMSAMDMAGRGQSLEEFLTKHSDIPSNRRFWLDRENTRKEILELLQRHAKSSSRAN